MTTEGATGVIRAATPIIVAVSIAGALIIGAALIFTILYEVRNK